MGSTQWMRPLATDHIPLSHYGYRFATHERSNGSAVCGMRDAGCAVVPGEACGFMDDNSRKPGNPSTIREHPRLRFFGTVNARMT